MRKIKHLFKGTVSRAVLFIKEVKKKRILPFSIAVIIMLFSLCILLYPPLSNYIANKNYSEVRTEYYETVAQANDDIIKAAIIAAQNYNSSLKPIQFEEALQLAQTEYNDLLNINGNGIMGYIEIPNIEVYLPIYHGTGTDSLNNGIGHLIGSSLPIGGAGTHTVLTGHSGVAGNRLFSDLDQMTVEDVFYLHILNDTLVYKVTEIHTVEPYDTSFLSIKEDKDRCTLITCTPFGVNTHRLLVQADRISSAEAQQMQETDSRGSPSVISTWEKQYYSGLILGGILLICFILIVVISKTKMVRSSRGNDKIE